MPADKTVIVLFLAILSISWAHAVLDEQETEENNKALSLFEKTMKKFLHGSSLEQPPIKHSPSENSTIRSMIPLVDDYSFRDEFPEDYFSENGSFEEHYFSGDRSDDDSTSGDIPYKEDFFTEKLPPTIPFEKDFTFEKPEPTIGINQQASGKTERAVPSFFIAILIVMSFALNC